jgi:uncharacterized repeat protein (TIGR01451 family)
VFSLTGIKVHIVVSGKWKFCSLIVVLVCILMFAPVAACDICTNGVITYTITVSYEGNQGYYVKVSDTLPAGTTFVAASDNGINSGGTVTWNFGPMPSGTSTSHWWTKTITVTAKPNSSVTSIPKNQTKVRYWWARNGYSDWTTAYVATKTTVVPCFTTITKTANEQDCIKQDLTYDIHVTYTGLPNQNIVVKDLLPAGVTLVSASDGGINNAGTVNWNFGPVPSGWSKDLTLVVNPGSEGTLTNSAISSVTGLTSPLATSNSVVTEVATCENTPEFPTMAVPLTALAGIVLITGYLKGKDL